MGRVFAGVFGRGAALALAKRAFGVTDVRFGTGLDVSTPMEHQEHQEESKSDLWWFATSIRHSATRMIDLTRQAVTLNRQTYGLARLCPSCGRDGTPINSEVVDLVTVPTTSPQAFYRSSSDAVLPAQEQKFFGSFFQKRTAFLLSLA